MGDVPRRLVAVLLALLAVSGCAQAVTGRAVAAPAPARLAIAGSVTRSPDPAADAVKQLQAFWRTTYPQVFGKPWRPIARFVPARRGGPAPPCVDSVADVKDQAFYCPAADAVAWDADGLIPKLRTTFGDPGVFVVLAHEVGHAVQTRLGVDNALRRDPQRYPTILLESMADCYAGVAVTGLKLDADDRDRALRALVTFRDPLGVDPGDPGAHGNAFDRAGAFQDGADGGARVCAGMTLDNHAFTQRAFGSRADAARGGNLPLSALLDTLGPDAQAWFSTVAGRPLPPLAGADAACADRAAQGPVAYCTADRTVVADRAALTPVSDGIGDYAAGTLVAVRYGFATLDALGRPTTGPAAATAAVCLAGAYTGRLIDPTGGGFSLSPGDLDEAVGVLLSQDWAGRDSAGAADPADHGYERVDHFRAGVLGGPQSCLTT